MNNVWRKVVRFLAGSFTSELVSRLVVVLGLAVTGGGAVLWPGNREVLLGAAAALLVSLFATLIKSYRENSDENYVIRRRTDTMLISDSGRRVRYETEIDVRARTRNLQYCDVRLAWSGQSKLKDNWRSPENGYSVEPDERRAFTDFIFRFEHPLRRGQRKRIRISFDLAEPDRQYDPQIAVDPRAYAWSIFGRLTYLICWDSTNPVAVDSITALVYRSGWDRYRQSTAAKQTWQSHQLELANLDGVAGRRWSVWPVRLDRWYMIKFRLSRVDIPLQSAKRDGEQTNGSRTGQTPHLER